MHENSAAGAWSYALKITNILFISTLLSILVAGCAPDSAWEDDPIPTPAPVVTELPLTLTLQTQTAPNDYAVTITWPASSPIVPYLVSRENKGGVPAAFALDENVPGNSIVDDSVVAGTKYTYSIFILRDGAPVRMGYSNIEIPLDKVINESGAVESMKVQGRLFLESGVVLTTNGQPLSIQAAEIHSRDAQLITVDSATKAEPQTAGKTPGNIEIRAKRGTGRLTITAAAQQGGDGAEGSPGQTGIAGAAGSNGQFVYNPEFRKVLTDPGDYDRILAHRRQNPPPPNDSSWRHKMENGQPGWLCETPPSNGAQGGQGTAGSDGTAGANGGDSPSVLILVEETCSFTAAIDPKPGLGGQGGRGGQGGVGGPGGPPGNLDAGHLCPAATTGPQGPSGPQGRTGRQGETGSVQPFCFSVAGKTIAGNCTPFSL